MPDQTFDPYVGAGLTYVHAMDNSMDVFLNNGTKLPVFNDRNMWGPAFQAGFDVNLKDKNCYLILTSKKYFSIQM